MPLSTTALSEDTHKIWLDSSQWCMVIGWEATDKLERKKFQLDIRNFFLLWGWWNTGTGYPGKLQESLSLQMFKIWQRPEQYGLIKQDVD